MIPLQIFEKHPAADAYRVGGFYSPYALVSQDKRFTNAELAAEFHSARADYIEASNHESLTYWTPLGVEEDATAVTASKRATTMLRFEHLPHAHETDYQ
ncbi:hypothetical protein ACFRJ8_14880 [Arthrobacter sp. NPDC056886]|uniref:hypothetical protein n=1 Tax=Arthrobacter sp. NPDC056886 TaxID=3345960 RepID=UPI00366C8906